MDEQVIAAMARWPNVPDVFGWLSLNAGGHWRLHRDGDALRSAGTQDLSPGESITSPNINLFINRNYGHDSRGQWYFQNGPQRVYVRLDVAPFILHTVDPRLDGPVFLTHNGVRTSTVERWCLDDTGRLYAHTDAGPGLIAGRDLEQVLQRLHTDDGRNILDTLEDGLSEAGDPVGVRWTDGSDAPFQVCRAEHVPDILGFVRFPQPER